MNTTTAILLIGAPGSGKSTWRNTWISNNPNWKYISTDELRAKLGTGEEDQSVSKQAFEEARKLLSLYLSQNINVVVDATNMHKKARKQFLDIANSHNSLKKAVVFECSREVLLERNVARGNSGGRNVPAFVIDRMLDNYEIPTNLEFNEIEFV